MTGSSCTGRTKYLGGPSVGCTHSFIGHTPLNLFSQKEGESWNPDATDRTGMTHYHEENKIRKTYVELFLVATLHDMHILE